MQTFSELHRGVLNDTAIAQFIETECIVHGDKKRIQPASLDILPDLNDMYELDYFYPPRKGEKVESILKELILNRAARRIQGTTIKKGKRYLVRIREQIRGLPFYVRMNPKSSPGRLFLHSRMVTDGHQAYDEIYPEHQSGCHWMVLSPKCFNITLVEDEPISQLRFFKGSDRLSRKDLEREMNRTKFIDLPNDHPVLFQDMQSRVPVVGDAIASNLLSIDMDTPIVAFKTKANEEPVVLSRRDINPKDYFEYIDKDMTKGRGLVLEENTGYLFGSFERIRLPLLLAAEVVPYSEKYGELRSHFAGFIDCGFGCDFPKGNSITFEIITYEPGHAVRHGQSVAELQYEYMGDKPAKGYAGNYKIQPAGPQLPKYFKK